MIYLDWIIVLGQHIAQRIPLLLNAIVLWMLAKWLFDLVYPFRMRRQLLDKHNMAYACMLGAFLIAVTWALIGTFFGSDPNPWRALWQSIPEGIISVLLILASMKLNDLFVLSRFQVNQEIERDQNLGTAFCVAGTTLASGGIIHAALTGYSSTYLIGLMDICLYWGIGQVLFVVSAQCYQWLTPFDVHGLIEGDENPGVGLELGAFLFGLGLIIRGAVSGSGQNPLLVELLLIVTASCLGVALMLVCKRIVAFLIASHPAFENAVIVQKNLTVSVIFSSITIGCGLLSSVVVSL